MLSTYVIHAVHILLELDKAARKITPPHHLAGVDFGPASSLRRPVQRRVFLRLIQAQYIAFSSSRKYSAQRHPKDITLLELIRLFHGDVCVGESYDHYLTVGAERFPSEEYRQLLKYENKMKKEMLDNWLNMPISNFQNLREEANRDK